MKKPQPKGNNHNHAMLDRFDMGFSLVEVMVAVVFLSIGFFAAASMQIRAVDTHSSAMHMSEAAHVAQGKLEELMALEYSPTFIDPHLWDDRAMATFGEPFTDQNGNSLWDLKEPYADSNANGLWDPAHLDPSPPSGYTVSWSVFDDVSGNMEKYIRVYVTRHDNQKTTVLTCIRSGG